VHENPRGIIVPTITPLLEDETVDYAGLEALLGYICDGGAEGIFQLSTTGEYARLPHSERTRLAGYTAGLVKGRAALYVGVSDTSAKQVADNIRSVEPFEPDFLVCSLPFYYPVSGEGEAVEFFSQVARSTDLPIILYNIPATCGCGISIGALRRLCGIKSIVGIKDSSGDMAYFEQLMALKELRPDFAVLSGNEDVLAETARLGCDGFVPSSANVFPKLLAAIWHAIQEEDWTAFERLTDMVAKMNGLKYAGSWMSVIAWKKYALYLLGLCTPHVTMPYSPLGEQEKENVRQYVDWMRSQGM
jgi:4-hydroxy-tetrahydrodipicolinate synthase